MSRDTRRTMERFFLLSDPTNKPLWKGYSMKISKLEMGRKGKGKESFQSLPALEFYNYLKIYTLETTFIRTLVVLITIFQRRNPFINFFPRPLHDDSSTMIVSEKTLIRKYNQGNDGRNDRGSDIMGPKGIVESRNISIGYRFCYIRTCI